MTHVADMRRPSIRSHRDRFRETRWTVDGAAVATVLLPSRHSKLLPTVRALVNVLFVLPADLRICRANLLQLHLQRLGQLDKVLLDGLVVGEVLLKDTHLVLEVHVVLVQLFVGGLQLDGLHPEFGYLALVIGVGPFQFFLVGGQALIVLVLLSELLL
ncbi:AAEL012598-PA [Aedes aegypti]|uniref:AAEL012598-PA n=1 Tax=Aedes aegypti TaxID=7159 RepID=Q16LM6_AEDAE|nr:AAEL012598-PA [Aedes aegypti]